MNRKHVIKFGLSLFIIFHLFVVSLVPNPSSFLTRQWSEYILPYANTLGLNTPWQFFSPDPSSHVYYDYEVIPESLDKEIKFYRWPPKDRSPYWVDNYMRLIYHSRFSTSSDERIHDFFLPWLCRFHPEAKEVTMRVMSEELVSLDKAKILGGPIQNLMDVRAWARFNHQCKESSEDVQ